MNTATITAEMTPNPNTLKFNVSRELVKSGSMNFPDREKARGAYLPESLFALENVLGVMVGKNFVTVTKRPESNWNVLVEPVTATLKTVLESDKILVPEAPSADSEPADAALAGSIEERIKLILDTEIRPAVAMDGGDIQFIGFQDGIVTLHLQGSCSSCPSSVMTLKMGVESRLKSMIPEVREVVQV